MTRHWALVHRCGNDRIVATQWMYVLCVRKRRRGHSDQRIMSWMKIRMHRTSIHPADTNNDHLQTSMACREAIRLFQRRPEVKALGMYRGVKNLRVLRTDIYLRRYSYSVTLRPKEINPKRVLGRLTRFFSFFLYYFLGGLG